MEMAAGWEAAALPPLEAGSQSGRSNPTPSFSKRAMNRRMACERLPGG
jgi:hypothetical protein